MVKTNVPDLMEAHEPRMTLRMLEKETGLSQTTIIRARTDKGISSCSLSTLGHIARALGVSIHDLFTDDPDQVPDSEGIQGEKSQVD